MKAFYSRFFVIATYILFSAYLHAYSQAPQYSYTPNSITPNAFPLSSATNLRQNLYYPSDFNAPSDYIDRIYIGGVSTAPSFAPLTIKMGPTTLTTFTAGSFVSGLTTVFSSNVTLTLVNGWHEVILTTPFYYDNTQNLIIEVSQLGYLNSASTPCASNTAVPSTTNRTLAGTIASGTGTLQARLMKMGFSFAPLGLDLLSFSAVIKDNKVSLLWKTANEENISKFVVERSTDGKHFEEIGEVDSKGSSSQQQEYSFADLNMQRGKILYRLKIVENSGSFHHSSTITINKTTSGSGLLSVYPLPFRNELFATLSTDKAGEANISLHDISGKKIATRKEHIDNGVHTVQIPNLSAVSPGIYELIVELNNTIYRETVRK